MYKRVTFSAGFTLIELLVVIAIIGLLASIVLTSLTASRAKARDASRRQTLQNLTTALELYANDHNGTYPPGGWLFSGPPSANNWFAALVPAYMPAAPHDPEEGVAPCHWDNNEAYQYAYLAAGPSNTGYKIVACNDTQIPSSDPMYDPVRPGIVFTICANPLSDATWCSRS